jgi:uncharacterized protein
MPPKTREPKDRKQISNTALLKAMLKQQVLAPAKSYRYPIQPPALPPNVVPAGVKAPVMAMDSSLFRADGGFSWGGLGIEYNGFPGYQYLATLALRCEFRALSTAFSTELTREWLTLTSTSDEGAGNADKIQELTQAMEDLKLRDSIRLASEHDCLFGRAQLLIDIRDSKGIPQDRTTPLIISEKTIPKDCDIRIVPVEPMWTTPNYYNSLDPSSPDFYKHRSWWMLGQEVHASRLITVITRPVPDIYKPAFNFSGISLSQLAEPYIDNWLRTRGSVSDLVHNFSLTAVKSKLSDVFNGGDGADVINRAALFNAHRDNAGVMLIDKETEDLVQLNVPLGGLHELQAQAQEGMCIPGKIPATILLGLAPSGFGNVAEGEMEAWGKWIGANQTGHWNEPVNIVLKLLQLKMYGTIDDDISHSWNPLEQMSEKELSEIRLADSQAAQIYNGSGIIDPVEERERLARDPDSGYQGLDVNKLPDPPEQPEAAGDPEDESDADDKAE